jgi:hypothetical protein
MRSDLFSSSPALARLPDGNAGNGLRLLVRAEISADAEARLSRGYTETNSRWTSEQVAHPHIPEPEWTERMAKRNYTGMSQSDFG